MAVEAWFGQGKLHKFGFDMTNNIFDRWLVAIYLVDLLRNLQKDFELLFVSFTFSNDNILKIRLLECSCVKTQKFQYSSTTTFFSFSLVDGAFDILIQRRIKLGISKITFSSLLFFHCFYI